MHTHTLVEPVLAAGVWQSGLAQVLGGLLVVAVLIGAFALGIRVRNRELPRRNRSRSPTGPPRTSRPAR